MKKLLKISAVIIGIVVVVMLVGYFVINSFLNTENTTKIANRIVSEVIQQPVEIGHVGVRIGFKIGITVEDVTISNLPGFSTDKLLQIDHVTLNLKLLPLLSRKIVIDNIELSGVKANLERNKDGTLNLITFIPKEAKGADWSFSLSSIAISKGKIKYIDAINKSEVQVNDLKQDIRFKGNRLFIKGSQTISLSNYRPLPTISVTIDNNIEYDTLEKDINIKKLAVAYDPILLTASGTIEKMTNLKIDAELTIDDLSKAISLIPKESQPGKLNGSIQTKVSIRGTVQQPQVDGKCELKGIAVLLKGLSQPIDNIRGSISFNQNAVSNVMIQGQIKKTTFVVNGSIDNLNKPLLNLTAKINGDLSDFQGITEATKDIKMAGPVDANITIKGSIDKPGYFGNFTINNGQIDGVGLAKPISNLQLKGTMQNDMAKIDNCNGRIGRTDFSCTGTITNFEKPIIQISNKSNLIDLDELLPKPQAQPSKTTTTAQPALLTLQGNVQINTLTGMDMVFKNINTNFLYDKGIIDLKNCSAEAFDGKVIFDLYYNFNSPEPYRITTSMTSISARKILKRFLKFEALDGTMNGVSNFQGSSFKQKEVIANMTASGNLKLTNGAFKNFALMTNLLSWLGIANYNEVKFSDLVCSFNIENGKTKVNDWTLSSAVGNFLTKGLIGLDGTLNLNLTTTLSKQYSDMVKRNHGDWLLYFDNSGKAVIDIIVTGTLTSPKFSLDANSIKKRLEGKLKDDFDKKKKDAENKLKDLFKWK